MKNANMSQLQNCDILVGVQLSDRNIDVPLYVPNYPTIRFASIAIGTSVKQLASEPFKVKFTRCDNGLGDIDGSVAVNKVKIVRASVGTDVCIDAYPNDSSALNQDIGFTACMDVVVCHNHVTSAYTEIMLSNEASMNKVKSASAEIGCAVNSDITANKESEATAVLGFALEMTSDATSYTGVNLSDIENMLLSNLSNTKLKELYWVENQ